MKHARARTDHLCINQTGNEIVNAGQTEPINPSKHSGVTTLCATPSPSRCVFPVCDVHGLVGPVLAGLRLLGSQGVTRVD